MKRIKENNLKDVLECFKKENLNIKINGAFEQNIILKNVDISFEEDNRKIKFFTEKNYFIIDLGYVNEILIWEKNKLKFLIENQLEILILFL